MAWHFSDFTQSHIKNILMWQIDMGVSWVQTEKGGICAGAKDKKKLCSNPSNKRWLHRFKEEMGLIGSIQEKITVYLCLFPSLMLD